MKNIIVATVLLVSATSTLAHELTETFPRDTQVSVVGDATVVEYCPDNTCEVFTLTGSSNSAALQDFAYAFLLGASSYTYLKTFQADAGSPSTQAVLGRYSAHCPKSALPEAAKCIVGYLLDKHPIQVSFVRYDEGERNVVPIAPEDFWPGT